jgi:hypothetical protein
MYSAMKIKSDHDEKGRIGWGGRIRTFTIHINSVVSYRLDHAPAAFAADLRPSKLGGLRHIGDSGGFSKIARPGWTSTTQLAKKINPYACIEHPYVRQRGCFLGTQEVD